MNVLNSFVLHCKAFAYIQQFKVHLTKAGEERGMGNPPRWILTPSLKYVPGGALWRLLATAPRPREIACTQTLKGK